MTTSWWYSWGGLNQSLFLAINHAGSGWLCEHLALWGTAAGNHALFPVYATLALALALKQPSWLTPPAVLALLLGYLLESGAILAIKPWLDLPRPPLALGLDAVRMLGTPEFHDSFPSGHSAFAFLLLAALWSGSRWGLRLPLLVFACWVAWSRMAVGAHFPADVLGGALIGLASGWLAQRLLRLLGYGGQPRRR